MLSSMRLLCWASMGREQECGLLVASVGGNGYGGFVGAGSIFSRPSDIHRVWERTRICARGQTHTPVSLPNRSPTRGHADILYLLPSLAAKLLASRKLKTVRS